MRCYTDSSAAAKLLIEEEESAAFAAWSDRDDVDLVGSDLVETEIRRLAFRHAISQIAVTEIMDRIQLHKVERSVITEAGLLPGPALRSLDALHLASALHIGVDLFATYDARLADAARAVGL